MATLDSCYLIMAARSRWYAILQTIAAILLLTYLLLAKSPNQVTIVFIPLTWALYLFCHNHIQVIISMYLRDRNPAIYEKYKLLWNNIRGYYPLANINLYKLDKKDIAEIADKRIITLIQSKKLATSALIMSEIALITIIVLKAYKIL